MPAGVKELRLVIIVDDKGTPVIREFATDTTRELDKAAGASTKTRRSLEDVGKSLKGVGQGMSSAGRQLGLATVMMTAGITLAVKKVISLGDEYYDLAQKTGVATEVLSGFALSAEKSGSDVNGVAMALRFLSRNMVGAASGNKSTSKTFKELGISVKDVKGNLRPVQDVLLDVAEKFSKMEGGAKKTNVALSLLGRSGTALIPFLNLGKKGLQENAEMAEKLGSVISGNLAQASDAFKDRMVELKFGLQGAARAISETLLPMLTDLSLKVRTWLVHLQQWIKEHPKLVKWLAETGLKVIGLTLALSPLLILGGKLVSLLGSLALVARGFGMSLMALIANPVTATIAAIAAVATALYLLYNAWRKWQDKKKFGSPIMGMSEALYSDLVDLKKQLGYGGEFDKLMENPVKTIEGVQKKIDSIYSPLQKAHKAITYSPVKEKDIEILERQKMVLLAWSEALKMSGKTVEDMAKKYGTGAEGVTKLLTAIAKGEEGKILYSWAEKWGGVEFEKVASTLKFEAQIAGLKNLGVAGEDTGEVFESLEQKFQLTTIDSAKEKFAEFTEVLSKLGHRLTPESLDKAYEEWSALSKQLGVYGVNVKKLIAENENIPGAMEAIGTAAMIMKARMNQAVLEPIPLIRQFGVEFWETSEYIKKGVMDVRDAFSLLGKDTIQKLKFDIQQGLVALMKLWDVPAGKRQIIPKDAIDAVTQLMQKSADAGIQIPQDLLRIQKEAYALIPAFVMLGVKMKSEVEASATAMANALARVWNVPKGTTREIIPQDALERAQELLRVFQALAAAEGDLTKKAEYEKIIAGLKGIRKEATGLAVDYAAMNAEIQADWIRTVSLLLQGGMSLGEGIKGIFDAIKQVWADKVADMILQGGDLWSSLKAGWKGLKQGFTDVLSGAGKGIGSVVGGILGKGAGKSVTDFIGKVAKFAGPVGAFISVAAKLPVIGPLINKIGAGITKVLSKIPLIGGLFKKKKTPQEVELENINKAIEKLKGGLTSLGKVSSDTMKAIAEDMVKKGLKQAAAEALHFTDILRDLDITQTNINKLWAKAGDVLTQYKNKALTAKEAQAQLGQGFTELLQASQSMGVEGSKAMVDFINKAKASGLAVAEVVEYINDQLGITKNATKSAAEGLLAMATGIGTELDSLFEQQAALETELADRLLRGWKRTAKDRELQAIKDKISGIALGSAEDMKRLESQVVATFNAMIKNGATVDEAMNSVGDTLDLLIKKHEQMGTASAAGIEELLKIRKVQQAHKELFDAVNGNLAVMNALANTGSMTQEIFTTSQQQMVSYFEQLKGAGLTETQALAQMVPSLERIVFLSREHGLKVDAATQALIDQARVQGALSKDSLTANEILMGGLSEIIRLLGGQVPAAFKRAFEKMREYGVNAASDIAGAAKTYAGDMGAQTTYRNRTYAQKGFYGMVRGPRVFIIEKGQEELVNIIPKKKLKAGIIHMMTVRMKPPEQKGGIIFAEKGLHKTPEEKEGVSLPVIRAQTGGEWRVLSKEQRFLAHKGETVKVSRGDDKQLIRAVEALTAKLVDRPPDVTNDVSIRVSTIDADSFKKVIQEKIVPELQKLSKGEKFKVHPDSVRRF